MKSQGGSSNSAEAEKLLSLLAFPEETTCECSTAKPVPIISTLTLGTVREFGGPLRAEETFTRERLHLQQKSVCTLKTSNKNRIYTVFL